MHRQVYNMNTYLLNEYLLVPIQMTYYESHRTSSFKKIDRPLFIN